VEAAPASPPAETSLRDGLRLGVPFGLAGGVVAMSFGVVAQEAGFSPLAAIVMSAIMFAGSAQFAAIAILGAGGSAVAAIVATGLVNSRFLPMGAALSTTLRGGPVRRALEGQATVDASWAAASRGDGTYDRGLLLGTSLAQYIGWVSGTIIGALGGSLLGDPDALGLDAVFPAFFIALLLAELRDRRSRAVAALGGLIALALVPITPPGVPVLAASVAALAGLTRSARAAARERT
jgi:4-azaleucine resistance transporter AzlC